MNKHENATNYIIRLIKNLDAQAEVSVDQTLPYKYNFSVEIKGQRIEIVFNRSTMDDFEYEITENQGTDRYYASEGFIKFQVYVALGRAGIISNFDISAEILNEKRDWLPRYNGKIEKAAWLYEVFYQGLKVLSAFLSEVVAKYKVTSEDIKEEQEDTEHLIDYYEKKHNFTERSASVKSLGYFKAAAVCVILQKEEEKKLITVPRVLQVIDKYIYSIVAELRENPFPQIKMSDCIYDYAEHVKIETNTSEGTKLPTKELVFIACGQSTPREKALGVKVKSLFKKNNLDSFLAETANDLESLNSHIFKNLTDCTGFIAILHKRDGTKYDTSVWINQEVAIAAYLRSTGRIIPSLVLYEEGALVGGLIRYTIANPPTFKSDEEALSKIEEWIKHQNFTYIEQLPEFDIILSEDRRHFGSSAGGGRNGYFDIGYPLSFRIRNKSNVNICLENVKVENELLGDGRLDRTNPRLSRLPFNVGPRITEEVNLLIKFPNEVGLDKKKKDLKLQAKFEFADRTTVKEIVGYLS